jgi:hypothetical protein
VAGADERAPRLAGHVILVDGLARPLADAERAQRDAPPERPAQLVLLGHLGLVDRGERVRSEQGDLSAHRV